jgi:hypothetical protein
MEINVGDYMFTKNKQFLDSALNRYVIAENKDIPYNKYYGRVVKVTKNEITLVWNSADKSSYLTLPYTYTEWKMLKYCRLLSDADVLELKLTGIL